jgi:hypothetical protein
MVIRNLEWVWNVHLLLTVDEELVSGVLVFVARARKPQVLCSYNTPLALCQIKYKPHTS